MLISVILFIQQLHWLAPAAIMFGSAPCFLMLWWPVKLCTSVLPRRFYRRADDFFFSTYLRQLLFFFENCTGIQVVFYGEENAISRTDVVENAVYISNHQSTVDWILGCSIALRHGSLSCTRYVIKDGLKYFPLYGFYLTQHETLFIKRSGKFNTSKAAKWLRNIVKCNIPIWLVIFPEGTRFNPDLKDVIKKSQEFSSQQGFPELQHVLSPRIKATQICLQELASHVSVVYDVTIAYSNTCDPKTRQRISSPGMPDFLSGMTPKVHIHIDKIPLKDIPTSDEELAKWLNHRFELKEKLLAYFYSFEDREKAAFPGEGKVIPLSLTSTVPSFLLWGGMFAACMMFKETRSLYWKTGVISLFVGLFWTSLKS